MAQQKSPFSASETTTYNIPGMNTIIIKTIRNVNRIEIRSHETTFPNLTETNSSKFEWGPCIPFWKFSPLSILPEYTKPSLLGEML